MPGILFVPKPLDRRVVASDFAVQRPEHAADFFRVFGRAVERLDVARLAAVNAKELTVGQLRDLAGREPVGLTRQLVVQLRPVGQAVGAVVGSAVASGYMRRIRVFSSSPFAASIAKTPSSVSES